jgi:hypothetical protein
MTNIKEQFATPPEYADSMLAESHWAMARKWAGHIASNHKNEEERDDLLAQLHLLAQTAGRFALVEDARSEASAAAVKRGRDE